MSKKAVFKFYTDCGRMGSLDGVFIATQEQVDTLIGEGINVYFGEVLGKHSEVYGAIEDDDITFITDDEKVIELFEEHGLSTGYNPFEYSVTSGEHEIEINGEEVTVEADEVIDMVNQIIKLRKTEK